MSDDPRCSPLDLLFALRTPRLSYAERVLLAIYRSYEDVTGFAWPGDPLVARHMGTSIRQMRRHRKPLLDQGWLEQRLQAGPFRHAMYRVIIGDEEQAEVAGEREKRRATTGSQTSAGADGSTGSSTADSEGELPDSPRPIAADASRPVEAHNVSGSNLDPSRLPDASRYPPVGGGRLGRTTPPKLDPRGDAPSPSAVAPARERTPVRERASEASQIHRGRREATTPTPLRAAAPTEARDRPNTHEGPSDDDFVDYDPETDTGYV